MHVYMHGLTLILACRCLLSKKAKPVMNLIYDLLSSIITFSSQVNAGSCAGFTKHGYAAICLACKGFRDTVRLLISGESRTSLVVFFPGANMPPFLVVEESHKPQACFEFLGRILLILSGQIMILCIIIVLAKLIARGYQPHLEELLLRLNFNSFY